MIRAGNKIDFTQGRITRNLLIFALPIIATNLLQVLYNAADMMVVSLSSEANAVGAVGVCGPFVNMIINIFIGFSTGSNVVIARHLGAKRMDEADRAIHTAVLMSLIFGFGGGAVGILLSRPILVLMGNSGNVLELALRYTLIYFLGVPFISLSNYLVSIYRAKGDSKTPFAVLSISGVLNVVLNLFFVLVLGLSVEGVAIATVLANAFSAGVFLVKLHRLDELGIKFHKLKIDRRAFREIIYIGLPSGIQGALFSISNMMISSSIIKLNDIMTPDPSLSPVLNGNTAGANLDGFVYTAMNSLAQATTTFISQNYGAARPDRIRKGLYASFGLVAAIGLIMTAIVLIFRTQLLSLYGIVEGAPGTADAIAFQTTEIRIYYVLVPYFLCGFMDVGACAIRALGKSVTSSIIVLFGACLFRVLWVVFIFPMKMTLEILLLSYPVSWIITSVVAYIFAVVYLRRFERKVNNVQEAVAL